jgi:hypothetical protein
MRWEARARLARVLKTDAWVLKDPRTCLTLPFFRAVIDVDPVIVMPYRNPLDVARSLDARNPMLWSQAMRVWERYVRSSIAVTEGLPVSVHGFEGLVSDPIHHVERLHGFLHAHGLPVRDIDDAMVGEIRAFISGGLRHHRHDVDEFRRAATPEQLALYQLLATAERAGGPAPQVAERTLAGST